MKAVLWVTPQGQAEIAAGRPLTESGVGKSEPSLPMENMGWLRMTKELILVDADLPTREECIRATLSRLAEQESKLREKLNEDLARIQEMRNNILAIEGTKSTVEEDDNDFPF